MTVLLETFRNSGFQGVFPSRLPLCTFHAFPGRFLLNSQTEHAPHTAGHPYQETHHARIQSYRSQPHADILASSQWQHIRLISLLLIGVPDLSYLRWSAAVLQRLSSIILQRHANLGRSAYSTREELEWELMIDWIGLFYCDVMVECCDVCWDGTFTIHHNHNHT